jgi:hypothetical protein
VIVWRRDLPRLLVTAGAGGVIVGAVSPWVASGSVERSSFEIAGLLERLGFASSGPFALSVRVWALVPLCVVAASVCVWWGRTGLGAALAAAGGLYAAVVSLRVARAPDAGLVRVLGGPARTLAGAVVLLAGAVVTVAASRTTRRAARAHPSASPAGPS